MSPARTARGPDAATLLRAALSRSAAATGCRLTVEATVTTRWASATFAGARHRLTLHGEDAAALDVWVAALPEADLPLRRHLVADVAVLSVVRADGNATIEIEALTVET